jgi:ATP-dependent DNA helicase DinG
MSNDRINIHDPYTPMIEQLFDVTGPLARVIPGYERRDGQVQLARDCWNTANRGGILLAEGPTGVGKSFAYAIPAILRAIATGTPSLIVTANKALQDQLAEKDLPLLAEILKDTAAKDFRFKLLKGRSNYVCQRELMLYETRSLNWPQGCENEGDALAAWVAAPPCSGDRNDAPIVGDKTWRTVTVSGDDCDHSACVHYQTCFAEKAAEDAANAHVVIVNYDLFYSKLMHSGDPFWHKFGFVVFDEAHEAAAIARRCFGTEITEWGVKRLATVLTDKLGERDLARQLRNTAAPIFEKIANYALGTRGGRLKDPGFVNVDDLCDTLREVVSVSAGSCGNCVEDEVCAACMTRKKLGERAAEMAVSIREFVDQTDDMTAYWLDKPMDAARVTGATVKLCAAPYQVGDKLRKLVFEKYASVVCVSATLAAGGSFDFIRNELGLTEPAMTSKTQVLRVASPFDYAKQAKFVIPLGIPFPTAENEAIFDVAAAKALRQIIHECKGRTLALFTSWRRLRYIAEQLHGKIDYPLLVQGDAPNKMLAQMFRSQTDSVLLATRSFWMGLDVSGESLSCLVVDKLPFESFDDPFVDMMKEKHPDTFYEDFSVPRATITLAQGAGRLIRSTADHGVFVLLDQRIKSKRYGRQFLASLPFKGFSQDLADAGKFLATR